METLHPKAIIVAFVVSLLAFLVAVGASIYFYTHPLLNSMTVDKTVRLTRKPVVIQKITRVENVTKQYPTVRKTITVKGRTRGLRKLKKEVKELRIEERLQAYQIEDMQRDILAMQKKKCVVYGSFN